MNMNNSPRFYIQICLVLLLSVPGVSFAQNQSSFNPTDDAYVQSDKPKKNFGSAKDLRAQAGNKPLRSYLKFSVSGLTGTVQSAVVRLSVAKAANDGGEIFLSPNTWDEGSITFKNAPVVSGNALSSAGAIAAGTIVELDVTAAVTGNGTYSFALISSSSAKAFYSSKEGTISPSLVVTTAAVTNQPPVANAGADQNVTDVDLNGSEAVTLDGSGSSDADGTIVSYSWTEGGTQLATGANPSVTLAVGTHLIDLTVTDDGGATSTDQVSVTVAAGNQPPVANAGGNQNVIDVDLNGSETVTLDGSASSDADGTIIGYSWTEGGTQIATGVNPLVTLAVGTHLIDLTVTDDGGATATDQVMITVTTPGPGNQPPIANAGLNQTVTDVDLNGSEAVTLDGSGSSDADGTIVSYNWTEGATQIATGATPLVTFAVGTHIIDLTITDDGGATATDQVVITVNQPPTADAGPSLVITDTDNSGDEPVILDGSNSTDADGNIVNYEWAENSVVLASGPTATSQVILSVGTHVINLTVTDNNNATSSAQVTVTVNQPIGTVVTLTFNPVADAYVQSDKPSQNFGSQNQLKAVTNGGKILKSYLKFDVSGVNGSVLSATLRLSVVSPASQGGSIFSTSNNWAESSITFDNAPPISGLALSTAGAVNKGDIVEFDVTPAVAADGTVSFNLSNSSSQKPSYSSREGSFQPELILEVGEGGNQAPIANAGPDQIITDAAGIGSAAVSLDGSGSSDADGSILSYVWTENGVEIATGVNPTVTLADGTHNISLTVTDNGGAAANDVTVIKVNVAPIANAGVDQTVTDIDRNGAQAATLNGALSADGDGTIVSYNWTEGANVIATGPTPSVTLTVGAHTIDLTVTDEDGATSTDQVVININAPPVANAGIDQAVVDTDNNGTESITLDGSGSSDSYGTIVAYSWEENGVQIATGPGPTLVMAVGIHTIDLIVTDDDGATGLDQVVIDVGSNQPPVASAGADQTVIDVNLDGSESVVLDGGASTDDGTIVSYVWSEGATQIATGVNPTVILALGVHTIDLTVTDNGTAVGTDQVIITVNQAPVADAGADQSVYDVDSNGSEIITLDGAGSSDADGTIVSYVWTEGTTQIATGVGPVVTLNVGVHNIDLTVTDNFGTSVTDQVVVTIGGNQLPVANAGPDQSVADIDQSGGEDVTLDGSASSDDGTITSYVWSEGVTQIATGVNPLVTLAVGVHDIDLTVTDNTGATGTDQVRITVNAGANQPPTANAGADQTLADADNSGGEPVTLDASASTDDGTIASYIWTEGTTQIATGVTPLVTLPVGSHDIVLTVTDDLGATATDQVLVTVNANQPPIANAGSAQTLTDADRTGAEDATLDASASSDADGAIVSYQWSEGGTLIATGANPLVTLAVGTHTIDLLVTDNGGATASDQIVVTVVPVYTLTLDFLPLGGGTTTPAAGVTTNHVDGAEVTISATPAAGYAFVNWSGALGIADPNSATTTVVMDGDKIITANFVQTFDLTLLVSPAGTGSTTPQEGTVITHQNGDVVSISASPAAGFIFDRWTGANGIADPNSANTTVVMDGNKTITASFIVGVNLTVAVFPPGAGTTTPTAGVSGYSQGSTVQISATPNPGFIFGYWTGIAATDADAQSTNIKLNTDSTITANFIELPPAAGETTAASLGLSGSLQAYGPLSIFGFPTYYTDSNGLSLIHGVNVNDRLTPENLALSDPTLLPDPKAPLDISTGNFFDESFAFSASATVQTASGDAIVVHAGGEAVFFTPDLTVQEGFQTSFNRLRLRVDLPAFSGETRTYTVTHPYGVQSFQVTSGGTGAINITLDSAPSIGFNSVVDGSLVSLDPFLIWTGGAAPPGYVGDPGVDHAVTGSPFNTNFFRIEGPDIGGPGVDFVQTHLFSISGRIVGAGPPPPPGNEPPVAYAGPDQVVATAGNNPSAGVTLIGSASFDPDGNITSYVWREGTTQLATGSTPTVTLAVGTHTINLTVTDNSGATHSDEVVVTVNLGNPPPVANAGPDQTVTDMDNTGDESITLDGSGSTDNGTIVSYVWTAGTLDTILATGVGPTVTLPVGAHVITLTTTDDGGAVASDQVLITVNPGATFTLTMSVAPAGGGTTVPAAGTATDFAVNAVVSISATASPGFEFVNWSGAVVADPNSASTTITLDANKTVTANFIRTYTLTTAVFPAGGGTMTPAAGSATTFTQGTVVNLTATPSPGFMFVYWTGIPAVDADALNSSVTMDADHTVTANFIEMPPASGETTAASLGLSGGLQAYGPLNIFGFPTYYTDSNGLSLLHGVNVNDPMTPENFGLVDPALLPDAQAPLSISPTPGASNFFTESFYFSGDALMNTANGRARLVLAGGEAVFFTPDGSVQEGWQTVFSRFRVVIDLPDFSGETRTYTVTHPYGVRSFNVTSGGVRAIFFTLDSAVNLGYESPMDGALTTIDPFLVWTNNEAPAGYVGNPNVEHRVAGSPFGTNFFRIDGPDIGGPGVNSVQTDMFTISGKIVGIPSAPVAGAGPDQSLVDSDGNGSEVAVLDGSGSFDLDGSITSYVWRENNSQIASGINPSVTLGIGSHTITLTVTDNSGATDTDQVIVEVLQTTGNTFVLTLDVFPPGAGTTTPAAGVGTSFDENTVATISATPAPGFIFGYWTGIPAVDANTITSTVTMDANKIVTANFIELPPAAGEVTAASLGLSGSLQAYGPLSIFGFPTYYTDSNGLSLVHGVDVTDVRMPEFLALNDPALLPDPNAPLDIATGNFFTESFYFSASSLIFTPNGKARLDLGGAEGVFTTLDGSVQQGWQTVFNRLRVRIDLPAFSGTARTYTVTHPYGVQNFVVTQGGGGAINFTLDSAISPGFATPLSGFLVPIDPFLMWTNEAPATPPGYVGDPNVDHRVTGSPLNTNFFRIEGPDIGGPGIDIVETDLFSISGKILPGSPAASASRVVVAKAEPSPFLLAEADSPHDKDDVVNAAQEKTEAIPEAYALLQNYPNPFNPTTLIKYALPQAHGNGIVRVDIYNSLGQRVRSLVNIPQGPGNHVAEWDGKDQAGRAVSSGLYIYQIRAGAFKQTRKMLFLK